jgi:hypothetical protein
MPQPPIIIVVSRAVAKLRIDAELGEDSGA